MNKSSIVITIALLSLGLFGCNAALNGVASSNKTPPQEAKKGEIPHPIYRNASVVTWEEHEGVVVEARLETLAGRLAEAPSGLPISLLTITNLATGSLLFKQEYQDHPISMYVRTINEDGGSALVLTWSGGSADRIEILAVDTSQARQILNEYYRLDAALISLSDGRVDVLITTAEGGSQPLYTTRYVWKEGRYRPMGRAPHKRLTNSIKRQFTGT